MDAQDACRQVAVVRGRTAEGRRMAAGLVGPSKTVEGFLSNVGYHRGWRS